jgi:uncharacterized protein YdhG (YjbR/CyaY superfamily)
VTPTFAGIDDYISAAPVESQVVLEEIRRRVHDLAPGVEETISYQMPTFRLNGRSVVHVAAWKHHVSLYPVPDSVDGSLADDLAPYASGKGTMRFPLNDPIPYELVERVVQALLEQNSLERPPT